MFSISKNCVCGDIGSLWNKRNMNWLLLYWNLLEMVVFLFIFFLVFFVFGGVFSANSRFPNSSGYGESFDDRSF